ncbi:hypothetical protein ADK53_29965 [Streptomyces sp. WM6373]|nr:hypothetical protein ADK53_29965 [Streptomyces sp. WM6373]
MGPRGLPYLAVLRSSSTRTSSGVMPARVISFAWLRMSTSSRAISSSEAPASRMSASVRCIASSRSW